MISTYVVSSNIQRLGWNKKTLFIQFNSGDVYSYEGVDFQVYRNLAEAESVGSYFHRNVRSRFTHKKLSVNPFKSNTSETGLSYTIPVANNIKNAHLKMM